MKNYSDNPKSSIVLFKTFQLPVHGSYKPSNFKTRSLALCSFNNSNKIADEVPPTTPPKKPPIKAPKIGTGIRAYPTIAPPILDPTPAPVPNSSFSNYLFLLDILAASLEYIRCAKNPNPPTAIIFPITGVFDTIYVSDPLIAAVLPKSFKNSFFDLYLFILAKQNPKEDPISPAAEVSKKLGLSAN